MANRAIITGVVWGKQIHNAVRFCREGRTKLCRKCQKPGHIQSHCPNVFKCGHCAEGHPTWECPSTRGQAIPVKCANCGGGHRPVSRECAVKAAAMKEAKQALADCPAYHRIPLHFRKTDNGDKTTPHTREDPVERDDLDASIHALDRPLEAEPSQPPPPTIIDLELEPVGTEREPQVLEEPTRPRRGPGRPKGSRTRHKEQAPPSTIIPASQRSTRSQAAAQRVEQDNTGSKKRRIGEPEDNMDEQPDDNNWLDISFTQNTISQDIPQQNIFDDELTRFTNEVTTINDINTTPAPGPENLDPESPEYQKLITLRYNQQRAMPVRSSPPMITTDAPTIEDPNDEVWHETSERSDNEEPHQ